MQKKINNIHFVGIKGVGMAPLAIIAKEAGIKVTGSDVAEKFITDEELENKDIKPFIGFNKNNLKEPDLVIYTGAHDGLNNIEVKYAKEKGIECLNQGQALGLFQIGNILRTDFKGISVAGAHGKTTTTSMLATIFVKNKKDPSYVIGTGTIPSLGASGHFGDGEYFITESDEYFADVLSDRTPKFLYQKPEIAIITNVDFDHPDIFENFADVEEAYLRFVEKVEASGSLIVCGDGDKNRSFVSKIHNRAITYGISPDNDFILERVSINSDGMFFWVKANGSELGEFSMSVFGEHNAKNALAAIVASLEAGLSIEEIKKGLKSYKGAKRRMEFLGKLSAGGMLFDDYAHHPEEIKQSLRSLKKAYPKHKIVTVFQPHMYSRTKKLLSEFIKALELSDEVLMAEIFPSFREKIDENFSSKTITNKLIEIGKNSTYFRDKQDVIKYIVSQKYKENTIILTMGAGDVYKIGEKLIDG